MESLCCNCDFVRLFISIFMYFICIVCILLSAANGVINDDDSRANAESANLEKNVF